MRNYIKSFCEEFGYPEEAKNALLSAYDAICANSEAYTIFNNQVDLYNSDNLPNHSGVLELMDKTAALAGANRYTVHLLFYICLLKHTRELYEQRNIPYKIFFDSMCDLKWKLFECHKMYGVWGSFVAWWFPRFFDLTRFALGRLQFETVQSYLTYTKDGYTVRPDDTILNVHIPSCGPLKHEDCLEAYRLAAEFYKDIFKDRPVVFKCESWLLYPAHKEFLPENSNILKFMSDYDIVSSSVDENKGFLWRIFYTDKTDNLDALPCETSLQRAYIDWLKKGNKIGSGTGIMIFR